MSKPENFPRGYLPLNCPRCGRRRLEYGVNGDGAVVYVRCEKCGSDSDGDDLDDAAAVRLADAVDRAKSDVWDAQQESARVDFVRRGEDKLACWTAQQLIGVVQELDAAVETFRAVSKGTE